MPNILIYIGVFLIVLFLYIHIVYQGKSTEERSVVQVPVRTSSVLEDMCNLRIPFSFSRDLRNSISPFHSDTSTECSGHEWKEIDISKGTDSDNEKLDELLAFVSPYMCVSTNVNFIESERPDFRSLPISTTCNRTFIGNLESKVKIMLWSPNSVRNVLKTYSEQLKVYESDDAMPPATIEYELEPNTILSVPPFWWISVMTYSEKSSPVKVTFIRFRSLANVIRNVKEVVTNLLPTK
jgi:hypothetical protein